LEWVDADGGAEGGSGISDADVVGKPDDEATGITGGADPGVGGIGGAARRIEGLGPRGEVMSAAGTGMGRAIAASKSMSPPEELTSVGTSG